MEITDIEENTYDPKSRKTKSLISREMRLRGFKVWRSGSYIFSSKKGIVVCHDNCRTSFTSYISDGLCRNKHSSKQVMKRNGVSIPEGAIFRSSDFNKARIFLSQVKFPVVKPVDGQKGRGVTVAPSPDEFEWAWENAVSASLAGKVIIEEFISGVEARYFIIDGKCIAVSQKNPPFVLGNGESSVNQLIAQKNAARKLNPHLQNGLIKINDARINFMRRNGFELTSVPSEGEIVSIDKKSAFSTGGESVAIMDIVHPELIRAAEASVAAFPSLHTAGVDIIAPSHSRSQYSGGYAVIEVNSRPSLGSHHYPLFGKPVNVAGHIAQSCSERVDMECILRSH